MVLIKGGVVVVVVVMSMFVGAYVSTWDAWPDQPAALPLTTAFAQPAGPGRDRPRRGGAADYGQGGMQVAVQGWGDRTG